MCYAKHMITTAYSPESAGATECLNQILPDRNQSCCIKKISRVTTCGRGNQYYMFPPKPKLAAVMELKVQEEALQSNQFWATKHKTLFNFGSCAYFYKYKNQRHGI